MKKEDIRILVACEESQAVATAFRERGFIAFSADIQEQSGGHPEYHIRGDVLPILNGKDIHFTTEDGVEHSVDHWDFIMAHPPCTHLAVGGAAHFEKKRADGRQREGIELFCAFLDCDCPHLSIENPVGIMSGDYIKRWYPDIAERYGLPRKPSQIIQPYEYGAKARKATCLWNRGLPNLVPTNIVEPELEYYTRHDGSVTSYSKGFSNLPPDIRGKVRSKTYPGIAAAIAEQWGDYLIKETNE